MLLLSKVLLGKGCCRDWTEGYFGFAPNSWSAGQFDAQDFAQSFMVDRRPSLTLTLYRVIDILPKSSSFSLCVVLHVYVKI